MVALRDADAYGSHGLSKEREGMNPLPSEPNLRRQSWMPRRLSLRPVLGAIVAIVAVGALIDLNDHPAVGTPRHGVADAVEVVGLCVFAALLGLWIQRRLVSHHVLAPHNDVAGFVYATIGVTYAVVLGFVLVDVWEQFDDAKNVSEQEANAVADLRRLSAWLPAADQQAVQGALLSYAQGVIGNEWPTMTEGGPPSDQVAAQLDAVWEAYRLAGQHTDPAAAPYAEGLAQLDNLSNARRERLLASQGGLPDVMAVVLVVGAVVTVAFAYVFGVEQGWAHGLMIAALAGTLGLLLFLTFELNGPYNGDVHVEPDGLQHFIFQSVEPVQAPA